VRRALLAAVAVAAVGAPAAQANVVKGLHDVRYCEILEARGALPDVVVTVWNTIGFNTCPAAWWESLDANAIKEQRGDLLVLLNGPRHWLMDVAEGDSAGVATFSGEKLNKVATISLHGADALKQRVYVDRTIRRHNIWRWSKGRRIFELVAPGGDTYVMQSYSQIIDKTLTLADLPALAKRLDLPPGWRYRSRTLGKELVLRAKGSATVLQDDLQNTYQLATTTRPAGAHARKRAVKVDGKTKTISTEGPAGSVEDAGTVTGPPFGKGTIDLKGILADGKLDGTWRLLLKGGSVVGTVTAPFTVSDGEIDFVGTGTILGGTGAYRGIRSGPLKIHDHNTLDGQNGVFEVRGSATY
jgi:hypothetical protein